MRTTFVNLIIFLFCYVGKSYGQENDGAHYSKMISIDSLKSTVYDLASDRMGGRKASTLQAKMAIAYIVQKFDQSGLIPFEDNYLQPFPFTEYEDLGNKQYRGETLTLNKKVFEFGKDFYLPYQLSDPKNLKIDEIIFLSADISVWADKETINGKAVVLLPGITQDNNSIPAIISAYAKAIAYGAKAVLYPSLQFFENQSPEKPDYIDLYDQIPQQQRNIPLISISWRAVQELIGKKNMSKLFQDIREGTLQGYDLPKVKFKLTWKSVTLRRRINNIIGFIPGRKLNNLVVIGAHFDHVGICGQQIFNGADDNASGVAGLIEIARTFSNAFRNGIKPERSIAFVAFNGEEAGLWGSYAFVNSIKNKDSVYAMINMDMIGRKEYENQQPKIYVLGHTENSARWKPMLKNVNEQFPGLELDFRLNKSNDPGRLIERSDQYPFLREGIPALFFFDNMKEDYHRPTDIAQKINFPLLETRVKFIFLTAWQLAYKENPKFRKYY